MARSWFRAAAAFVALTLLASGCGTLTAVADVDGAVRTLDGAPGDGTPPPGASPEPRPLIAKGSGPDVPHARPYSGQLYWTRAAREALRCAGKVGDAYFQWDYKGAATPEAALARFVRGRQVPRDGYRYNRVTADRVLFTLEVAGRPRAAVIVANDHDASTLPDGWGSERYAACDPSEFPRSADAHLERQIWTDPRGKRVSTRRVFSVQGSEHCSWESTRILMLGGRDGIWYVRDPEHVHADHPYGRTWPPALLYRAYKADADLPKRARDTGFRRDGQAVWLTGDAAYVVSDSGVEFWPRATEGWGCA